LIKIELGTVTGVVAVFGMAVTQEEISIYCSSLKNCIMSFIYTYIFNPATPAA
jgi:hypothetical protein